MSQAVNISKSRIGEGREIQSDTSHPEGQTATVRNGERSLADVARRLNVPEQDLLEANRDIKDPKNLTPGREVKLPAKKEANESPGDGTNNENHCVSPEKAGSASKRSELQLGGQINEMMLRQQSNETHPQFLSGPGRKRGMDIERVKQLKNELKAQGFDLSKKSLQTAAEIGNLKALKLFNELDFEGTQKCFLDHVKSGNPNAMAFLRAGIEPDFPDNHGRTALMYAARTASKEHNEIFAELLSTKKVSLNVMDNDGRSVLNYAASSGESEKLNMLLTNLGPVAAKQLINVPDKDGKTPLIWAAHNGVGSSTSLKLLLAFGADANAKDSEGNTALTILASHESSTSDVEAIIGKANLDDQGPAAMKKAAASGNIGVMKLLAAKNVFLDVPDSANGMTPLMEAVASNRTDSIRWLLQNGADPNIQLNHGSGESALHFAVRGLKLDTLKALLEHPKVKINSMNWSASENGRIAGSTPMDYADRLQWIEAGVILRDAYFAQLRKK